MKDEMYIAFRSYLEEQSQLLQQILEEVRGQKAAAPTPLERYVTPEAVKMPTEAVGPVTVETVQTLDSGKEDDAAKGKPQGGKPGAKPAVNWNSAPVKE